MLVLSSSLVVQFIPWFCDPLNMQAVNFIKKLDKNKTEINLVISSNFNLPKDNNRILIKELQVTYRYVK